MQSQQLNPFQRIAWDFPLVLTILANEARGDFALVPLEEVPLSEEVKANFHRRGLGFLGVIGCNFSKPEFRTVFTHAPLPMLTLGIAQTLAEYVARTAAMMPELTSTGIPVQVKTPGADWLERLASLPDTRTEN
jgi:hypothetical protein